MEHCPTYPECLISVDEKDIRAHIEEWHLALKPEKFICCGECPLKLPESGMQVQNRVNVYYFNLIYEGGVVNLTVSHFMLRAASLSNGSPKLNRLGGVSVGGRTVD